VEISMTLPVSPFRHAAGSLLVGLGEVLRAGALAALVTFALFPAATATAQGEPSEASAASAREAADEQPVLQVGTKVAAPFSFKDDAGTWTGLSIELWRGVAEDLGLEYELKELSLQELVAGVEDGSLDAGVAALTITAEREEALDFSHPFHTSGLGIAVVDSGPRWLAFLRSLASLQFLQVLIALSLVLLLAGGLLWIFERHQNPDQFGGGLVKGLGQAFWWSAVTMTTVGYGDKAPVTLGGRLVGLVWMFASVIIISGFTAAIASSLTVQHLQTTVGGPEDLPKVRVATVAGTTSEAYLRVEGIDHRLHSSVADALEDLTAGNVDAVVYDAPILLYLARLDSEESFSVLPSTFIRQDYGIAFPTDSPLREAVNVALLERIRGPRWQEVLFEYFGQQ
jgi:ABC-type amino acid transport substrate-binding protein